MILSVEVVSASDREELVAEIWCDDAMVAELRRVDPASLVIEIYPNPSRASWEFPLEDWVSVLDHARVRLTGMLESQG